MLTPGTGSHEDVKEYTQEVPENNWSKKLTQPSNISYGGLQLLQINLVYPGLVKTYLYR
jgi:hypothetical protein